MLVILLLHRMKLADFGLSHGEPSVEFIPFAPGGTPMYEPPEMLTGKNVTKNGDVWALGVIGYELCELKTMFRENTREAVKEAIRKNAIPMIGGNYSDRLRILIDLMLQKNPSDRIDLFDLLEPFYEGALMSRVESNALPSAFTQQPSSQFHNGLEHSPTTVGSPSSIFLPARFNKSGTSSEEIVVAEEQKEVGFSISGTPVLNRDELSERVCDEEKRSEEEELLNAAMNGDQRTVIRMTEWGCDVNGVDEYGMSAIHFAAYRGDIDMVEYLVEHGCDVNRVDDYGVNALHLAAYCGYDGMVRYLVALGCDVM